MLLIIAPQVYYTLYLLLSEGLPKQWVLNPLRTLDMMQQMLNMTPPASYAGLATGLVLWTLILGTIWQHLAPAAVSRSR